MWWNTVLCSFILTSKQSVQFTVDLRIFKPTPFPSPHHTFCDCYSSFFIGKFKWKLLQLQDQCYINTWKDAFGTQDISTNFCYLPSLTVHKVLLTSKRTFLNFLIANPTLDSQFEESLIMPGALSCLLLAYRNSLVQTGIITEDNRCDTPTHVSCVFCRNDSQRPLYTWPWHHKNPDLNPHQLHLSLFHWSPFNMRKARRNTHTRSHSLFPVCDNSYKTPVILSHTQAGSQREPADQVSREKLWRSSNVMGFDVDAELHYGTPMKSERPLFICRLHMQRTSAKNMHRFSYASVFWWERLGPFHPLRQTHFLTHPCTSYFCIIIFA